MLKGPTQRQVAQQVVDLVVGQRLPLGSRINEQALARRLGVSRTPVRAVLTHLVDAGALERRPRQGFFLMRRFDKAEDVGLFGPVAPDLHDRIMMDILLGTLDRTMSQNALVRRYGVSRGELTAALRRMTREGLAEPAPGQGWTFVQFDGQTIQKGYRLRLMIEPAVLLDPDYAVDERAIQALRRDHVRTLRRLSPDTAWAELFGLDSRFHETLAAGSGNELVVEVIQKQNQIRRLCEYLGYERLDRVRASFKEHQAILDSLLGGDREWAAAQLRRHLRKSLDQSLNHYAKDIEDFRSGKRRFGPRSATI